MSCEALVMDEMCHLQIIHFDWLSSFIRICKRTLLPALKRTQGKRTFLLKNIDEDYLVNFIEARDISRNESKRAHPHTDKEQSKRCLFPANLIHHSHTFSQDPQLISVQFRMYHRTRLIQSNRVLHIISFHICYCSIKNYINLANNWLCFCKLVLQ